MTGRQCPPENVFVTITAGNPGKDRHCGVGQRYDVLFAVLSARAGDGDCASVKINLVPHQSADFVPPTAGQQQQLKDGPVAVVRGAKPHGRNFLIRQNPFPLALAFRLIGPDNGVHIAPTTPD